jgi:ubiquinone/menaquinone biosynthesis C-methylase UbiE
MAEPIILATAILDRIHARELSPAMGLMELLIAMEDAALVTSLVAERATSSPRVAEVAALLDEHAPGCGRIVSMLQSGGDSPPENGSVEEGIAFSRKLFDWSVQQSEEASVALYSLGSPALLRAATEEIAAQLEAWGSLGEAKSALDIGCGIGRMEQALAPQLGRIDGIDVSPAMIAVARRRCGALPNALFSVCSGLDLRAFDDACFDLVLAVDSFPYLVQSGMALVATHFAEARRVLRPNGELVVLNFSYRDDLAADRATVDAFARAHGFDVLVAGTTPFAIWSGSAFRMKISNEGHARVTPSSCR